MRILPAILILCIALCLTSCDSRNASVTSPPVAAIGETSPSEGCLTTEEYPALPMTPGTIAFRKLLEISPFGKNLIFWGNYGGPGNDGGAPVDAMDVLFLKHDLVYVKKESFRALRNSDRVLANSLEQLDPKILSKQGRQYRKRAISYMRSPMGTLGKLIGTINNPPPPPGLPELKDFAPFPFPELRDILGPLVQTTKPSH